MDLSFGARLRSQRERRQVPLTVIAERTKIKASLLEGLERDDVAGWPRGIFRRSFIRAYAEAIGLPAEDVVREFLERHPEPVDEDVTAALAAAQDGRRPPTRLGYLIATAFSAFPAVAKPRARRQEAVNAAAGAANTADAVAAADTHASSADDGVTADIASDYVFEQALDDMPLAVPQEPPVEESPGEQPFLPVIGESAAAVRAAARADDERAPAHADADIRELERQLDAARVAAARIERDVAAMAALCTRLGRASQPRDITAALEDAARVLRAIGIILWVWDPQSRTLGHVLAHGYSREVLGRLPRVESGADNAIADAFRTGETRVVAGSALATGAVVVPILSAAGCVGALAVEVQDREEERPAARALAALLAAQLAAVVGIPAVAEAATA